jgi:RNA polymerase sigma-70 factor (ECF subfamily)
MEDTQSRYLAGLRAGDRSVFEEIYKEYFSPLCHYCIRFVGKPEEAEEIVQGLFVKLWVKRDELQINTSVNSYLYRAVQNYALNHLQQQKIRGRFRLNDLAETEEPNSDAQGVLEEDELNACIRKTIGDLPEKRRIIFELSRFSDMKYQQIAEHLDISVKTVEAQMAKALQSLRHSLKEYLPLVFLLMSSGFFNK